MTRAVFQNISNNIGRVSFNDYRRDIGAVREVFFTDTTGKHTARLNLDTHKLEAFSGSLLWTLEEVLETLAQVYRETLAPLGIAYGEKFGTVYDHTTFGLYNGRKPRWMTRAQWAVA